MGPRPFGRGRCAERVERDCDAGLQWGRDLSAAEGDGAARGRAPIGALQWGRDLSAAEGASQATWRQSPNRFNGAATFRPRKAAHDVLPEKLNAVLQWGRDLSAAEGLPKFCFPCISPPCFNGAATFRPRKAARRRGDSRDASGLQWGRDLSAAEGP